VDVVFVEAAVFGELGATGEDNAGFRLEDDVGRAGILSGVVEFVLERAERKDFLDAEGLLHRRIAELSDDGR
jgi:hypothetical protein